MNFYFIFNHSYRLNTSMGHPSNSSNLDLTEHKHESATPLENPVPFLHGGGNVKIFDLLNRSQMKMSVNQSNTSRIAIFDSNQASPQLTGRNTVTPTGAGGESPGGFHTGRPEDGDS